MRGYLLDTYVLSELLRKRPDPAVLERLRADLGTRGEGIGVEDALIGATAMANGLTVVTRNLKHFERIEGLKSESWWPEGEHQP